MIKILNDISMTLSSFSNSKSQIPTCSLHIENVCEVLLQVIKKSTMWNVESKNKAPNSFALIEIDWVFSLGFFFWIKSIPSRLRIQISHHISSGWFKMNKSSKCHLKYKSKKHTFSCLANPSVVFCLFSQTPFSGSVSKH